MSAMPNAGLPSVVEGRKIYLCSPEYMAQYARRFLWAGVKIVGGCCGTTAEHIKLIRAEARSLAAAAPGASVDGGGAGGASARRSRRFPSPTRASLGAKLAAGKFVAFVEILPPRGVDASKEIEGAKLCAAHGIDCINVPDGPRASARLSAQVTCQLIQQQAGHRSGAAFLLPRPEYSGHSVRAAGRAHRGGPQFDLHHGRSAAHGHLSRMPPPCSTWTPSASRNIVNNLNHGLDIGGNPIGSQTALLLGVGANPGALNMDEEIRRMEWKAQAGAEYIVTQPVFDLRFAGGNS